MGFNSGLKGLKKKLTFGDVFLCELSVAEYQLDVISEFCTLIVHIIII
jgi:hypothetical protein